MKKVLCLILALVMCLGFCSCAQSISSEINSCVGIYETEDEVLYSSNPMAQIRNMRDSDWAFSRTTIVLKADGTGTIFEEVVQAANYAPYDPSLRPENEWRLGETVREGTLSWTFMSGEVHISMEYDDYDGFLGEKPDYPTHKTGEWTYKFEDKCLKRLDDNEIAYRKIG